MQKNSVMVSFIFALACHTSLEAQVLAPFPVSSSSGNDPLIDFQTDGTLIAKTSSTGSTTLASSDMGAGTRMLWYPNKSAFRAGTVSGTEWNDQWNIGNIGVGSTAFGIDTLAFGAGSIATGYDSVAGTNSVAMGQYAYANYQSVALGSNITASANWDVALGCNTSATGMNSVAIGTNNNASGYASFAMGVSSAATGSYAQVMGNWTAAIAYNSFVVGCYNLGYNPAVGPGTASMTTWVSTDPLFEVGNGTSTTPSDALIVYKNGNVQVQGTLRCSPGGDLSMGNFTAGTAP